ncbi:MAG: hypothetical protein AAFZ18_16460 [Myxococcota bacterium]
MAGARAIVVVVLGVLGAPAWAHAQAPGPMSRGHADLDGAVDCNRCHSAGFGVPDDKCLACHDHQGLRRQIEAGRGFHVSEEVKGEACRTCHAEHVEEPPGSGKGRRSLVDWKPFGGRRNFDHRLTGWPLDGKHRYTKCEKCHTGRYPKSGLPSFLGQRRECTTCHFTRDKKNGVGGENPHRFTDPNLTDCTVCHDFAGWEVAQLGATRFDHDQTDYPISGHHTERRCTGCHENLETFEVEEDFSDCDGCHEDSHRSVVSAERDCKSCHSMKVKFRKTRYDHAKESGWPLRGKHAENRCKDCHRVGSKPEAPESKCITCHEDVHKGRFDPEPCEGCHVETGFERMVYDHAGKTTFPLTGTHSSARCQDCHRFGIGLRFEKFESNACADCHKHRDAHCGQFGREDCERCHVQGGDRTSKFDHSVTRLPLEQGHKDVDCERCHEPEKLGRSKACRDAVKYTGLEPQCFACHADTHEGELGKDCVKCHTGGTPFDVLVFDHDRDADFPLTGFHQLVGCETCHPRRDYILEETRCASCHGEDDVHEGALGDDCASCHETTGGTPKFDHALQARFPLEGVHDQIECARCHFVTPAGGGEAARPATLPPGGELDLKFGAVGDDCVDCHPDPHEVGREPLECGACHGADSWVRPPRNAYHEGIGFSLTGAHAVVGCQLCHEGVGSLQGRGERCGDCHLGDDIHAGSLGADCGRCHEQEYWLPSRFTHTSVGYVLGGVHRMLDCRSCHQAGNYFIGNQCLNCHLDDYRGSTWHQIDVTLNGNLGDGQRFTINGGYAGADGNTLRSYDCGRCHNQFTFFGAYAVPQ